MPGKLEFQPSGLCKWCVRDCRIIEGNSVIKVCLVGTRVFEGHWSSCLENHSFSLVSVQSESFVE